ncbi:hypothetical protein KEM52_003335 [Ascosphaera acerosa]|nr:hypothetical protein KEM52_003335 [Ascosphaera acerosa]
MRDYAFLASAYILEPCWKNWLESEDKSYGLGRDRLPHAIAGPLYRCAQLLDIPPFLSYAASYALYNWKLADSSKGLEYDNLRLVRAFERGLDPKSSEAGFILTHVDMVKLTGALVDGAVRALTAAESGGSENRGEADDALRDILAVMEKIEASMEEMWAKSKSDDYLSFRVFIFGVTSQTMFPNGVVYEGIEDEQPLYFRGESGANDSIIPLLDHLCQIPMPMNPLTKVLHEFRAYRPLPHREFLTHVRETAEKVQTREYFCAEPLTAYLYLRVLDHVRSFRWRHWLFTREYIIRKTSHPTATGGSPIVTWLPNQLFFVMDLMIETYEKYLAPHMGQQQRQQGEAEEQAKGKLDAKFETQVEQTMAVVREQKVKLDKEVDRWCQERKAQDGHKPGVACPY